MTKAEEPSPIKPEAETDNDKSEVEVLHEEIGPSSLNLSPLGLDDDDRSTGSENPADPPQPETPDVPEKLGPEGVPEPAVGGHA